VFFGSKHNKNEPKVFSQATEYITCMNYAPGWNYKINKQTYIKLARN
jgi:hypothetical protein